MSRIGKKPIPIPDGVKVGRLAAGPSRVEGPKGKLTWTHRPELSVAVDAAAKTVVVEPHQATIGSAAASTA